MPEAPATPATPATPAATPEGQAPDANEAPKTPETPAPKETEFDGPYDEDRAKALITKLREEAKAAKAKASEYEKAENERKQAEMSDLQKAIARAEAAEKDLADRNKADLVRTIAEKHSVPAELLTADTEEALEAQAAKAAELIGATKTPAPGAKPKPKLSPGSGGEAPEAIDHVALAARMKRR